ncbi:MAG TPA: DUF1295 domain-containing protein [Elusimicrobiota bacterium]|jgi:steroid 5-alpha reductase family enzyme|nr:DUF1295 domain-containing protein [Elusimicrobiota bacterium]
MSLFLQGWSAAAAGMLLLWLRQQRTRDAGIVDVGWAAGLGALAILHAARSGGDPGRRALLAVLAALWSARLAFYLGARVAGRPEDGRYRALRERWGADAGRNFLLVFQANALLDALFSIPYLVVCADPRPLGPRDAAAAALWLVAVGGESLADRQLARFRADPARRGRTCRDGLWRYSRHPNYFFEWLQWWTYVLMAPAALAGAPALLGPALMLLFLYKVTGIPATEAQALKSRPDYAEYQRVTSPFIPWRPNEDRH